jgi:hypothetical protein
MEPVDATPESLNHLSLSQELIQFVDGLDGQDCSVGELVDRIGDRGFGLLLMVLALPAALPLPAPGYATPFGILMIVLGFQMLVGRQVPWLPERFRKRNIKFSLLSFSLRKGGGLMRLVEFLVRPRFSGLARNRVFLAAISVIIIAMACSMTLPIPLTNTAPSFVIFILAAGILEEDGLALAAGLVLAPVAAAISIAALYFVITQGVEAVETQLKPMIKGLLGMS